MKRKVISVLALTLIVLMSVVLVSCEDMLPVAPEDIVNEVVGDIKAEYTYFKIYINNIAFGTHTPDEIKTTLKTVLENEYDTKWGSGTTVSVQAGVDSISAVVEAPDGKNKLDINYSNITLDSSGDKVTGNFSITITKPDAGAASSHTMDTAGNFSIAARDSITFSSVSYRGTDYDTDAFNKRMQEVLP